MAECCSFALYVSRKRNLTIARIFVSSNSLHFLFVWFRRYLHLFSVMRRPFVALGYGVACVAHR